MKPAVTWRSTAILALAMLGAGGSEAGEVNLSAESKVGYDSNVFSGNPDEVETGVIMFKPKAEVRDELERGSYLASYSPAYFINTSTNAGNTWNHRVFVDGTYHFSPRTQASLSNSFDFLEKVVYSPTDPDDDANLDDSDKRTTRNTTYFGFNHMITRRLSVFGNSDYTIYRYSRSRDDDSDNIGGAAGLSYQLTRQLSLGGGGNASYWSFDAGEDGSLNCAGQQPGPGSRSLSYSGFAQAAYVYDETTQVSLRAGPAWIDSSTHFCSGPLPTSPFVRQDSTQTTWFAEGEVFKRWQYLKTSVKYRRSEGVYGGAGQTSVNDSVIGRVDWQPARFWDVELRLGWIRRTQEFTNPGNNQDPETNTWTAALNVSRQIAKRLRVYADVSYRDQNEEQSVNPDERDFNAVRAFAGIVYSLDPIRY